MTIGYAGAPSSGRFTGRRGRLELLAGDEEDEGSDSEVASRRLCDGEDNAPAFLFGMTFRAGDDDDDDASSSFDSGNLSRCRRRCCSGRGFLAARLFAVDFGSRGGGAFTTSSGLNGASSSSSESEASGGAAAGRSNLGRPSSSSPLPLVAAAKVPPRTSAASRASGVEYGSEPSGGGAFSSPAREYETDRSL